MSVVDQFRLDRRNAIVTGASRGIGSAIARALAEAGAAVHGLSRNDGTGGVVRHHRCDVSDVAAAARLVNAIADECGPIDILINAAGISVPAGDTDAGIDTFDRIVQVNLTATFHITRAVLARMATGGSIVNIGSLASTFGFSANPGYVASKAGIVGLTKALAIDAAVRGIRVNCLVPGYIRTDMTAKSQSDPEMSAQRVGRTMLGRWGEPEDLAGAAVFLASPASAYVTGAVLNVDGGWSAKGL